MKRFLVGIVSAVAVIAMSSSSQPSPDEFDIHGASTYDNSSYVTETIEEQAPICDGTSITSGCIVEDVKYATYIYHPAVAEVTRTETSTRYEQQITGYCTLCNDGTFSPSCATGRGACSHHGGVAQWNAPRYSSVPRTESRIVVDSPAREAYYEKVEE